MPLRPDMETADYLDILRRRKWIILFSVLLVIFGATVYCVLTPDQYRSTVKLIIIPPAVAEGMVQSTVNLGIHERLLMIRQDVLSRTRLMGLINEVGLSKLGFENMSPDQMLEAMRKRIIVDNDPKNTPKSDAKIDRDPNIFLLSFIHEDPQLAKGVASRLASFFVEENIKTREAVTQETAKFLASQVEETRKKLEQQEEKLKGYKIQFGGELPQQEQANLNRLTRLQDQIKNNSESLARLADRKVFLQTQISSLEGKYRAALGNPKWTTEQQLLSELSIRRAKLEELNEKYTSFYPTVVQARREVELLEAKIARLRDNKKGDGGLSGRAADPSPPSSVPDGDMTSWESEEVRNLRDQIASIDLEMVALKRENASASHTIDAIQRKMERLPQREQEIISLTRDYENLKTSYEELLKKKLHSQISETLEQKQKGEQFRVMEPATLPTSPFKPDRLRVLGLALMVSLSFSAGAAIVYEMLDQRLRGSKDFKSFFDLPVLASLPVIQNDRYKRRIAVRRAAIVGGLVSILGAYLAFLVSHGEKVKSILQSMGISI